jgi:hypothetical protein
MRLSDLERSAGILPLPGDGLTAVLADIRESVDDPVEEFLDGCRYSIRVLGALIPLDRYNIVTLADLIGLDVELHYDEFLEVLLATGDYDGEMNVNVVRALLGMIDDGVPVDIAGEALGVDVLELDELAEFLSLEDHWRTRILDRTQIIVNDGGDWSDFAHYLHFSDLKYAKRLFRWARRELKKQNRA